ncbi:conserved membrane hypothetical protein [Vibrio crassostreae]|nr:conserved membrane hypothetical protein [Vibrio chagasii]CAK2855372.1 conserved membrane hypothetical protein [Vibrio crassostreae]
MQKSLNNIIKSIAETAFVSGATLFPIIVQVSHAFLLGFIVFFLLDILTKKWADPSVVFFHVLRDYFPAFGAGLLAHSIILSCTGGLPVTIALYGVLGVTILLFYCFSVLILLAKKGLTLSKN